MLRVVHKFCVAMWMKLAIEKSVVLTSGAKDTKWSVTEGDSDLVAVISAKYLGITVQVKGRNLNKKREVSMISVAKKYAHVIMRFSRIGQDKAQVASLLWEKCTIPAILHPVEAMTTSKGTIMELNRIHNTVSRFVLQLLKSEALAAGYIDAGMKLMQAWIMQRTCLFVWKMMNSSEPLLSNVIEAIRRDHTDIWNLRVSGHMEELGAVSFNGRKVVLKKALFNFVVKEVLVMKQSLP